jgi:hypothetical protein
MNGIVIKERRTQSKRYYFDFTIPFYIKMCYHIMRARGEKGRGGTNNSFIILFILLSGKTLSYLIPSIAHIKCRSNSSTLKGPTVLILLPTRELVIQVVKMVAHLKKFFSLEICM